MATRDGREASPAGSLAAFLARHRYVDYVIPFLTLALCLLWSTRLPIDHAPDEYMRLPIPFYIFEHGKLPIGTDPEIRNPWWGTSYAFTPYGASLLSFVFMRLVSLVTMSEEALIVAARFPSALFMAGTTLLCEKIGKRVFDSPLAPYCLALFVGLLPQVVFLGSYLNQDAMEVFATALIIHAWLVGIERRWDVPSCLLLAIGLGVCALSYYFTYIYLLASVAVYFATARRALGANEMTRRQLWGHAVLITVVALAVGGWFFARNYLLYDGDLFGRATSSAMSEQYAVDWLKPSVKSTLRSSGVSPLELVRNVSDGSWLDQTVKSFIGCFGYMTTWLSPKVYLAYRGAIAACAIVAPIHLVRGRRYDGRAAVRCALAVCGLVVFAFAVYYSWASDYQPQGRYLMGALLPLALVVGSGMDAVGSGLYLQEGAGRALRKAGTAALILFAVAYVALFCFVAVHWIVPEHIGGILAGGPWR